MIKTPDTIHNLRDVDVASPSDADVLTYNAVTKLWGAEAVAGGAGSGDMLKSVYDTDEDGVVDDAEDSQKLDGSTKAEVQDHTPKAHASSHEDVGADEISVAGLTGLLATAQTPAAHTHVEVDVTDLDHDAQKIKSKTVDAPLEADDEKFLQYDHANSKFVLTAGGGNGGATTFLGLTDTPDSYVGQGGKAVKVKSDASGLEFGDCPMAVSSSKSLTTPIPSISCTAALV